MVAHCKGTLLLRQESYRFVSGIGERRHTGITGTTYKEWGKKKANDRKKGHKVGNLKIKDCGVRICILGVRRRCEKEVKVHDK